MDRKSQSLQFAVSLKGMADKPIRASNPYSEELKKAAKHIEWLELILTGITYADRRTIAKLTRKKAILEKMVKDRDDKIGLHKQQMQSKQTLHDKELKRVNKRNDRSLVIASKISRADVHKIERKFIKDLQTGFQKGNALSNARWNNSSGVTATDGGTDGGWHQVYVR